MLFSFDELLSSLGIKLLKVFLSGTGKNSAKKIKSQSFGNFNKSTHITSTVHALQI